MCFYIEVPDHHNKAEQMERLHDATHLLKPMAPSEAPDDKTVICVVVNPMFDAVGVCFNDAEYEAFIYPDSGPQRRRTWMLIDKEKARELCPSYGRWLADQEANV